MEIIPESEWVKRKELNGKKPQSSILPITLIISISLFISFLSLLGSKTGFVVLTSSTISFPLAFLSLTLISFFLLLLMIKKLLVKK